MSRTIKAPTGTELQAKSWLTEAPLRMLMNNLDPDVAEKPDELIIYGGTGKAARNWDCYHRIVATLERLENDETLLVASSDLSHYMPYELAKKVDAFTVRTIADENADLIVMGVHGRRVVDLMIFGSTTHQVVRQAPCPVLTIRAG